MYTDVWVFCKGSESREANVAVQSILSLSHRDPEEVSLLFQACPDGPCMWVVGSGTAARLCKHREASPSGRMLTVMPYCLIGSHRRGAAGRFFLVSVLWGALRMVMGVKLFGSVP